MSTRNSGITFEFEKIINLVLSVFKTILSRSNGRSAMLVENEK